MNKPKILLLDFETLANLKEVMRVLPGLGDWPGKTIKSSHNSIICFGYKWYGEKKTKIINAWDYKAWGKDVNDDKDLCRDVAEIIKQADCIVTHNGVKFDWKVIQTRLYINNLPLLPKIIHIDTKKLASRFLFLNDNRLNTVARYSNIQKMENGGWDLWCKVMERDPKAMKLMSAYCKKDVDVLEAVFKRLLPFVSNMPNYNLFRRDAVECCSNCGGFNIIKQGQKVMKTRIVQKLKCTDCGSWMSVDKKFPKSL